MSRLLIVAVTVGLMVAGCGDGEMAAGSDPQLIVSGLERRTPTALTEEVAAVADAEADFAATLYGALSQREGNVVFSPVSIHLALTMALAGADGDTASQMEDVLEVDGIPSDRLHNALNALDRLLEERNRVDEGKIDEEDRSVELSIVNALWGQQGFDFERSFLDLLALDYGAGMRVVDFATAAEDARAQINEWVADSTNDRIPDLIPPGSLDALTRLVLTNAIYLDADWQKPFDPDATRDDPFTLLDGEEIVVPTMHGRIHTGYGRGDGFQAVELPYTGRELSMVLIVPDPGRFEEVEQRMSAGLLDEVRESLESVDVQLALPKFDIRTTSDLSRILVDLGMADAFSPGAANFTGITRTESLYISRVQHEAFITVDEAGTEAAAATAVIITLTAAPLRAVDLDIDRPFLFTLGDVETGAQLFMGRVLDPS